jgi:hypothetical protein
MNVKRVIERIQSMQDTYVDCSIRQGRDAIHSQLNERAGKDEEAFVDITIEGMKSTIAALVQRAMPYELPDDYVFFLEFSGGLAMYNDDSDGWFSILGVGPMVEDWYGSVDGDEAVQDPGKCGFLSLGSRGFGKGKYRFKRIVFLLDLTGTIHKHCVIGIGPCGEDTLSLSTIINDIHSYPNMWRKIANSFTEWLEQAAETHGTFGYT